MKALTNARPLAEPVRAAGRLGLWDIDLGGDHMKFDVAALRAAAEKAIDSDRARWEEARIQDAAKVADERAQWMDRWAEQWLDAAKTISRKVRKGQPVVREDLPGDRYHTLPTYSPPFERKREYVPPHELTSLLRVLGTVADETVTSTGLRELGITGSAIRQCVAHMARASVKG